MKITEIIVEGRKYVPIKNGTFAHDIWITRKVRMTGLSEMTQREGESQDDFIDRLAVAAWESGALLDILGGLLVPDNVAAKDWTPELAEQTTRFFGEVTDPESKKQLRMQIGGVLFYFFVNALSSSKISMKSGTQMAAVGERPGTEGASITEIGAT